MKPRRAQRYYVPELDQEIMVETTVRHNVYVAHYPGCPERVTQLEMREGKWEHLGDWDNDKKTMEDICH